MDDNTKPKKIKSVRDLEVYKLAFNTAMEIYEISKKFPEAERYSLTDQIRRSSRDDKYEHIFAMLNNMEKKAKLFCS